MNFIFNDKTYILDEYGFLKSPENWDENFAQGMAQNLGIYGGLTSEHWKFIKYLRKKFLEEETVPVVVIACSDNKLKLHQLKELFPTGYHRGACKIAGINYEFMYKHNYWLTYETSAILKSNYKVNSLGFLEDFEQWDEKFAHAIIREWKLTMGLTERHKGIIYYLRDYYRNNHNIPTIYEVCRTNNISLEEFRKLFPEGYRRGACLISGLPFMQ